MSDPVDTSTEAVDKHAESLACYASYKRSADRHWRNTSIEAMPVLLRALVSERDQLADDVARLNYESMEWRDRADAAEALAADRLRRLRGVAVYLEEFNQ